MKQSELEKLSSLCIQRDLSESPYNSNRLTLLSYIVPISSSIESLHGLDGCLPDLLLPTLSLLLLLSVSFLGFSWLFLIVALLWHALRHLRLCYLLLVPFHYEMKDYELFFFSAPPFLLVQRLSNMGGSSRFLQRRKWAFCCSTHGGSWHTWLRKTIYRQHILCKPKRRLILLKDERELSGY